MIKKGFVVENPITSSRITVLESEIETQGRGWLLEYRSATHNYPDIPEHLHLDWTETFEIISGTATYKLGGVTKIAHAGEKIVMPPMTRHVHPWNESNNELVYQQRDDFGSANMQAVQEVLGVFATTADLAREGKVDQTGKAKNPLQLAVFLKILSRHGGYDASLPIPIQNFIAATLGTLGEALGYRAINSKYIK